VPPGCEGHSTLRSPPRHPALSVPGILRSPSPASCAPRPRHYVSHQCYFLSLGCLSSCSGAMLCRVGAEEVWAPVRDRLDTKLALLGTCCEQMSAV